MKIYKQVDRTSFLRNTNHPRTRDKFNIRFLSVWLQFGEYKSSRPLLTDKSKRKKHSFALACTAYVYMYPRNTIRIIIFILEINQH